MRLSKIKLSGFKSFVDPTPIHFPGDLVGIVGPNGCGKSNVIDAIRWVMGESSAKNLRGDSMADVIFNGSSSRKPVGTATVELFFDNSDGAIGGQFAKYNEICIKRLVSRDGMSQYFINNVRCRRKDITHIFLGTGLGPRSYAIIEQGMISRLIEAKPDEMRVYIEEAAGISKYKDRRRETEIRIRHTRDNLDRLNDLREEIEKQIKHLQRQANQAERYRTLKQEERTLEAELLAIRLNDLRTELDQQELQLSQRKTALEAEIAEQRAIESHIERARQVHIERTDEFNAIQGRYYSVQAEISKLEQSIAHFRETRERQREDLRQAEAQLHEATRAHELDQQQLEALDTTLEKLAPDLEQGRAAEASSAEALRRLEASLQQWQENWHAFSLEAQEYQQTSEVEATRIEQLEVRLSRLKDESAQIGLERQDISIEDMQDKLLGYQRRETEVGEVVESLTRTLADINRESAELRQQEQRHGADLERIRGELESRRGRVETLEALQEAALGQDQDAVNRWAERERLADRPRLAKQLAVEKPWERAVETVLGDFLQAICVANCEDHLARLPNGDVVMVDAEAPASASVGSVATLLDKVERAGSAAGLLASVRTAERLEDALSLRAGLGAGESVITPDGIWLGQGWVRISRGQRESGGIITRQQDIRQLRQEIEDYERQVARLESERRTMRDRLAHLEKDDHDASIKFTEANRRFAEAHTVAAGLRGDFERISARLQTLVDSGHSIRDEIESVEQAIGDARAKLAHAAEALRRADETRPEMQAQRETLQHEIELARARAEEDRARVARINVDYESRRASRESTSNSLDRVQSQREQLESRVAALSGQVGDGDLPLIDMQEKLEKQLGQEIEVDRELSERRAAVDEADTGLRDYEGRRAERERKVSQAREAVDGFRMHVREIEVRREGLVEQFSRLDLDLDSVTSKLAEEADVAAWEERLGGIQRSIERLGAINLAAIDEFSEQSERKTYLDAQYEDLTSALATLENAIKKIDRETRTRFQETFDNVNNGLQRLFPKLFGGGHAYLILDGDDLLNSGVTVMARPPGKRNSSIHLLSGGEKALTAVALVFSIFELNPAPFCLLDEVDAPLDDANVGRFCDIVKEMSTRVQFLVITHNKATMEMASQLTGVTMNEPGVSRLVSVDIDEAVQLVAS